MNPFLIVPLILVSLALGTGSTIVGTWLARRAYSRWRWPEAQLIYRTFIAKIVLFFVSVATLPLIGWLIQGSAVIDLIEWVSLLFRVVSTVLVIAFAVGLYRLARRASYSHAPSTPATPIEPTGMTEPIAQES